MSSKSSGSHHLTLEPIYYQSIFIKNVKNLPVVDTCLLNKDSIVMEFEWIITIIFSNVIYRWLILEEWHDLHSIKMSVIFIDEEYSKRQIELVQFIF